MLYTAIMQTNTRLRNRVRERRTELGLTRVDVAARAGISRATLWSIEKDEGHPPSMPVVLRLAAALEVEPGWLFYEGEEPS